jgi:RNA recognition motif-containing protein
MSRMTESIFVGKIPISVQEEELRDMFAKFGKIVQLEYRRS